MGKVRIKNRELLVRILKTVSWLDDRRWTKDDNYNFLKFFRKGLKNHEKILTHWLCYITDRQMPYEIVWEKGGQIFSELVWEYSRNKDKSPEAILDKYYESYRKKGQGDQQGKKRFRFKSKDGKTTFASRYVTDDYKSILQTLEVLDRYDATVGRRSYKRNIVAFILEFIQRFKGERDLLVRIACALHLVSYRLENKKADADKIVEILKNRDKFKKNLKEFKKNSAIGKKRLWCCVRDYKKGLYNRMFGDAIREVTSGKLAEDFIAEWNNLPIDQIELPGDVWNNNSVFKKNLFSNVLDLESIPKIWNMPQIIRDIYNQLKNDKDIDGFYPEQFDITFDFVPRMCSAKACHICLFGKNGVDLTCIPTRAKYCPVALVSCDYVSKCTWESSEGWEGWKSWGGIEGCILREGISRGICRAGLR